MVSGEHDKVKASSVPLDSLAPSFEGEQHQTYLNRLNEAVKNPKNRNIALTGRYGAGKSSVLERFAVDNRLSTLKLAISTFRPQENKESVTNRIQKELVKQIVYSASSKTLRHSQFRRPSPFPWVTTLTGAAVSVAVLGALMAFLGWLPKIAGTSSEDPTFLQILSWGGFYFLLVATVFALRWMAYERLEVSDISAGGASVKLSKQSPTYFDEYLDDIVNYFDTEGIDFVVFEDLDRFEEPKIFEALRELNTLLNNTEKRTATDQPLRFIYAVRDSLFDELCTNVKLKTRDAASAETERANRTKFFDLIIPIVPFISHRNARELLTNELAPAGINNIDRRLINLVAQHCTDMRLLRNIRNEYLVFAERLLDSKDVAPGLTSDNLFALVVYKNFHLADFENISRRKSALDRLYYYQRKIVREAISSEEAEKRKLLTLDVDAQKKTERTELLAKRLQSLVEKVSEIWRSYNSNYPELSFVVGRSEFSEEQLTNYNFWQSLAREQSLTIVGVPAYGNRTAEIAVLNKTDLTGVVPEAMKADQWEVWDADDTQRRLTKITRDIAFLRGADFVDLASSKNYKTALTVDYSPALASETNSKDDRTVASSEAREKYNFEQLIAEILESDLARELIKRGYIDRNFGLYAAQFYGHFAGIDVANFLIQNVQTNTMDIYFPLRGNNSVANLLKEADEQFSYSVAAYNLDVVDYLLITEDDRILDVVEHIATDFGENARTFLIAYLTSGAQPERLISLLARYPWPNIYAFLVQETEVPESERLAFVDTALSALESQSDYVFGSEVYEYVLTNYRCMPVFVQGQTFEVISNLVRALSRLGILIPQIEVLDVALRALVVTKCLYEINPSNLVSALSDRAHEGTGQGVSLDRIMQDERVYEYCIDHPDDYLAAVDAETQTQYAILREDTLVAVVRDVLGSWDEEQLAKLFLRLGPEVKLQRLDTVPKSVWSALADVDAFHESLTNVEMYIQAEGSIDSHLAGFLERAGSFDVDELEETANNIGQKLETVALAILNTPEITTPAVRVALVVSLGLKAPLKVEGIEPEANQLFALLLEKGLISDNEASFSHFREGGWAAIGPAIEASDEITEHLKPATIEGMVPEVLSDPIAGKKIGDLILASFNDFISPEKSEDLTAVAEYAARENIALTPEEVIQLAYYGEAATNLLLALLSKTEPVAIYDDIQQVFTAIGEPYEWITQKGAQFEVPKTDTVEALLKRLQSAEICTVRKKPLQEILTVTVH